MRRRAATLVEILLAAGLTATVLTLVTVMLVSLRKVALGHQRLQTVQQELLQITYHLRQDYRTGKPDSLNWSAPVLSFLSYQPVPGEATMWTPQGEVAFRKWVQYRRLDSRLERRVVPLANPHPTPPLQPPNWAQTEKGQLLSRNLLQFEVLQASRQSPLLKVLLTVQVETSSAASELAILPAFGVQLGQ